MFVMVVNGKLGRETDASFILTFSEKSFLPETSLIFFFNFPEYSVEMLHSSKKLCNYITDTGEIPEDRRRIELELWRLKKKDN